MRATRRIKKLRNKESHSESSIFKCMDERESKILRETISPRALVGAVITPKSVTLRQLFSGEERINMSFMDHQRDVTYGMRHILFDWIVDVCSEFHLGPQSLFVSCAITDRILQSKEQISKGRLQLLGILAMILSCNIVNRAGITPTYGDFSYISDNTYSAKEISDEVERVKDVIGSSFDHRLTLYDAIVKIFTDLPHWMSDVKTSLLDQDSLRVVVEAQKNAELAIMHVDTYRYPIARVAVACVVHARQQFNRTSWNEDLERCTGFTWSEVLPAVRHIRRIRGNRTNLVAVEIKYRDAYIHMCRYRRSQLLYVVPRPAYHQICDVVVDYRDSDGKHQLLRDDGNKASARWLDLREIPFTIESLPVSLHNLPKLGDHVICYDRVDETVDPVNAIVCKVRQNKKTGIWTVDVEYASVVVSGVVEKDVELERLRYWDWKFPLVGGRSSTNIVSRIARWTQISERIEREREKLLRTHWVDVELPNHLLCPISNSLMVDPVIALDGYTYERVTIQRWMSRSLVSPMTGKPLSSKEIRSNIVIRNQTRRLFSSSSSSSSSLQATNTTTTTTKTSRRNRRSIRRSKRKRDDKDDEKMRKVRQKLLEECFQNDETKVPRDFLCPLTSQLLVDPVVADNGLSYEKNALLRMPKNNEKNIDSSLWPNKLLMSQIRNYRVLSSSSISSK